MTIEDILKTIALIISLWIFVFIVFPIITHPAWNLYYLINIIVYVSILALIIIFIKEKKGYEEIN
ncbi:MAG: hypothetical protein NDF54_08585 [archaeon GB-1867-035]|nr:hypothetical protein [Candidatus Culexmicrobium profundum]